MANSSRPPQGPTDGSNLLAFRRSEETSTEVRGELMRRRSDVHDNVSKVSNIRPDITGRQGKTPDVAKAIPRGKQQATGPELPQTIPSIARGKITGGRKVAKAIDHEYMARSVREAARVEMIAGSLNFTRAPASPEDTARALLHLRDEDLQGDFSDTAHVYHDDDDVFIPVAQELLLMFPKGGHLQFVDDSRILSLVSLVRDPDAMHQRILGVLNRWKRIPISGKRVPAVIRGK